MFRWLAPGSAQVARWLGLAPAFVDEDSGYRGGGPWNEDGLLLGKLIVIVFWLDATSTAPVAKLM